MRILVVDDSEDWRDLTAAALADEGFDDVRGFGSAAEAFEELHLDTLSPTRASPVDLILLDIIMPDVNGIEACAQIRNHPDHADVPIIMLTAADDVDGLASAFEAGATDYITKPFSRVELLARVRAALKTKAELDRRRAREDELIAAASANEGVASRWVDATTGLFVGEIAEAYLSANNAELRDEQISVVAVAIDRMDTRQAAQGDEPGDDDRMARVADAVLSLRSSVGTVAATYLDGVILVVAPKLPHDGAQKMGETIRTKVSELTIPDPSSTGGQVTVSVGAITTRTGQGVDDQIVKQVRTALRAAAAGGGNRVVAVDLSCL